MVQPFQKDPRQDVGMPQVFAGGEPSAHPFHEEKLEDVVIDLEIRGEKKVVQPEQSRYEKEGDEKRAAGGERPERG